jgi:transcriptional regulator with XRE-family HTH domain
MSIAKFQFSYNDFGKRLKTARNRIGVTGHQLAEFMNLPQSSISKMEHGNQTIGIDKLVMIADRYNICIEYLLYGTGPIIRGETDREAPAPRTEGANMEQLVAVQADLIRALKDNAALREEVADLKKRLADTGFVTVEARQKGA